MQSLRRRHFLSGPWTILLGLTPMMVALRIAAAAALSNAAGGWADGISNEIDSAVPTASNPLGASIRLAGADQDSADLTNGANGYNWVGLFDPIAARNAATDWQKY